MEQRGEFSLTVQTNKYKDILQIQRRVDCPVCLKGKWVTATSQMVSWENLL